MPYVKLDILDELKNPSHPQSVEWHENTARAAPPTITDAQLATLQAEIAALKAQVAALQRRLDDSEGGK